MTTRTKQVKKNGVTYTRVTQIWSNGGRIFSITNKIKSNERKK